LKPDLRVQYCGVSFKNPVIVASASPTKDGDYMRRCAEAGAGGLISKTFSPEPLTQKYVSPRFTVLHKKGWPHCYSNYSCEFLATYDTDEWFRQLALGKKACDEHDCTFVGSISGVSLPNWAELAKRMEDLGSPMIELNFGCPHPRDLGYKSGQVLGNDPKAAAEVTKTVVDAVGIPVFVKLTGEAVNIVDAAGECKQAGASGFTVINRYSAMEVDIHTGRPILHSTQAGVGGPWMRPITLKWIAKIAQACGLPISATNGIFTAEDMIKMIMVGATTCQTCTALMYGKKQYGQIRDFVEGIEKWMVEHNYETVEAFRGMTLPQIRSWDNLDRENVAISTVDREKCVGCGLCPNWCFFDAINMTDSDGKKKALIDPEKCDGCGLCAALCPSNAIAMEGPVPVFLGDFS
jgi:dihydroorotate dehydrogenase (fumarate)/dihydropyrimidine dehydrogenase (NAD+) subunit PreA